MIFFEPIIFLYYFKSKSKISFSNTLIAFEYLRKSRPRRTFTKRDPMSRIAMSKRTASSISGAPDEMKKKARVPLGLISSNRQIPRISQLSRNSTKDDPVRQSLPSLLLPVVQKRFTHVEIPIGDKCDSQDVVEFEHIIYRSLRDKELTYRPLQFRPSEITLKDRNLLIDAIDRFHYKLALTTNTLYRFIGVLDRFLSVSIIPKSKLHLYGCAAFLIASKIEDICPALSTDLMELSGYSFSQSDLFTAEIEIINGIQFDTTFATALFYLTHISRIYVETRESLLLSRYILELCQTHERFFGLSPSLVAAVAMMVTRILKGDDRWPIDVAKYTMHSVEDLNPLADVVHEMLIDEGREECRFIKRKYGSDLFERVADIEVPESFN
jgi:hypothetical protein